METKICSQCHEEKSLDEFYEHPNNSYGRGGKCKKCAKQYSKLAYQEIRGRNKRMGNLIFEIQDKIGILCKELRLNV